MDRRERLRDPEEALRVALDGMRAGIWTAMPVIIDSFDAVAMTATAHIALKAKKQAKDSTITDEEITQLVDCPVIFPNGGGYVLTFPLVEGDEGIAFFASRCIDSWWQSGGLQIVSEIRMHDLSDAFILVGARSQPRKIANISTTATELRSEDATLNISVDSSIGQITLKAPTKVLIDVPNAEMTGNLKVDGNIDVEGTSLLKGAVTSNNEGTFNSHTVGHHTHTDPQGGSTGLPTG